MQHAAVFCERLGGDPRDGDDWRIQTGGRDGERRGRGRWRRALVDRLLEPLHDETRHAIVAFGCRS